jgi:hypothetical protein
MVLLLLERLDEQALLLIFQLLQAAALARLGAVNKALRALLAQKCPCGQALWKALCISDFTGCLTLKDSGGWCQPLFDEPSLGSNVPCECGLRAGGGVVTHAGHGPQIIIEDMPSEPGAPRRSSELVGRRCRCGVYGSGSVLAQDALGLGQLKCWIQRYARLHSIFSVKLIAWSQPVSLAARSSVGARQGAAGDIVWDNLVVFGGWDSSNNICNDVQMLLLSKISTGLRWERLAVRGLLPRAVYGSALTRIESEDYGECALVCGGVLQGGYRSVTSQWAVLRQAPQRVMLGVISATTSHSLHPISSHSLHPHPNSPPIAWGDVVRPLGVDESVYHNGGGGVWRGGGGGGQRVRDYKDASECEYEWVYPQGVAGGGEWHEPTPRAYHTATYIARHGVVLVFGGFAQVRLLDRKKQGAL